MLLGTPIPKHESSGRHFGTRHVAARFGCSPAAVRQMVARGELEPAHVLPPTEHQPAEFIFHADYIEQRARARGLRITGRAQLDQALGFRRATPAGIIEVQAELPLGRDR